MIESEFDMAYAGSRRIARRRHLQCARARCRGGAAIVTTYGGTWEKFWRDALLPAFTK